MPMLLGFICIVLGFVGFWYFMGQGASNSDKSYWSEAAKISMTFASTALGYVFGRGTR